MKQGEPIKQRVVCQIANPGAGQALADALRMAVASQMLDPDDDSKRELRDKLQLAVTGLGVKAEVEDGPAKRVEGAGWAAVRRWLGWFVS